MATRWGCLGAGKISSDFFTAVKDNLPADEHEFVAVASRDLGRSQAFAEKFKFKRAYDSYDKMAGDPDIEIVYIGTINTNHAELSIKMLNAGKHVLCEKPMAMNSKHAKQVLDVAKKNKRFFAEAVWSRWVPSYRKIEREISEGAIGDPRFVQAVLMAPIADVERIKNIKLGGGSLLDMGIYPVQFACFIYKQMPESITAVGNMRGDVDESACIILKYKNGAMANLTYHSDAGTAHNTACVLGNKGRIDVDMPFYCPTDITTPTGSYNFPLKKGNYFFMNNAGLQYEAAAARECIQKGLLESANYSHTDSLMVHTIMDEVRRQIGMKYPDFD